MPEYDTKFVRLITDISTNVVLNIIWIYINLKAKMIITFYNKENKEKQYINDFHLQLSKNSTCEIYISIELSDFSKFTKKNKKINILFPSNVSINGNTKKDDALVEEKNKITIPIAKILNSRKSEQITLHYSLGLDSNSFSEKHSKIEVSNNYQLKITDVQNEVTIDWNDVND